MKSFIYASIVGSLCSILAVTSSVADDTIEIVITPSRSAQTVDDTLVPVTIISDKEIQRKQAVTVEEVLREVPGVTLTNSGGLGKFTTVSLRGTESDHVLVLVDGVKIGSATAGLAAFQDIPLDQVERIEVVRGPRSSLYGSEAIGGVIQIFTRKGQKGFRPDASISIGSHNTTKGRVGISGGTDQSWYNFAASAVDSDGFNACRGKPFPDGGGCFTVEPDDDGHQNASFTLRGGTRLNDRVSVEGHVLRSDSETEFDGVFQNKTETIQQIVGGRADITAADRWSILVQAGQAKDESDNLLNGVFASQFDTIRDYLTLQNDVKIGNNGVAIAGIDYQRDKVESSATYTEDSRDNTGIFVQLQTMFEAHDVQASIRNDDNEQFGNESTGSVAWGYELTNGTRATASYGTAFKAPTFNDLYFPDFGNPNLDPETSASVDIGLRGKTQNGRWTINLFNTTIDDLITFNSATFLPENLTKAKITGVEISHSGRIGNWSTGANLTLQKPEHRGNDANRGNQLPRRPKSKLTVNLDRAFSKLSLGATVNAQGKSFDDLANTIPLDSFVTVDLRSEYQIHKNWNIGIKINNILDEEYETAAFFNQDGINSFVTLRSTFDN